jgi:hypothetical protein
MDCGSPPSTRHQRRRQLPAKFFDNGNIISHASAAPPQREVLASPLMTPRKERRCASAGDGMAGTPSSLLNRELRAYHVGERRILRASSLMTHASEGLSTVGLLQQPATRRLRERTSLRSGSASSGPRLNDVTVPPQRAPAPIVAHPSTSAAAATAGAAAIAAGQAAAMAAAAAKEAVQAAAAAAKAADAATVADRRSRGFQILRPGSAPPPPQSPRTPLRRR